MTGALSKNFHGVGIGPLSKILAVNGKSARLKDMYAILHRWLPYCDENSDHKIRLETTYAVFY